MAEDLEDIARRYGIVLVIQFGSTVRGTAHQGSDVDIGVLLLDADLPWQRQAELQEELQERFPDRKVDLVVLNHADPLLLRKVLEAGKRLYGSERRFKEWKIYAYKRYQDHRPYLDMERRYVRGALAGSQ